MSTAKEEDKYIQDIILTRFRKPVAVDHTEAVSNLHAGLHAGDYQGEVRELYRRRGVAGEFALGEKLAQQIRADHDKHRHKLEDL